MSGFFDDLNRLLSKNSQTSNDYGLPDLSFNVAQALPPTTAENTSPDAVKADLINQGYTPPYTSNPYAINEAEQFSAITNRPSPFTVIDLDPSQDNGTRLPPIAGGLTGQNVYKNNQPVNSSTLDAISKLLNTSVLSLMQSSPLFSQTANTPGVTYNLAVNGSSLRIDRLPLGYQAAVFPFDVSNALTTDPRIKPVTTALIGNDVYLQSALNTALNGIFVQFNSLDSPVFLVKPGEVYNVLFNTLFITTFGSAGRYRVIAGNKASVVGNTDERVLRQNLHIWDGGGLLDSPSYHPVPFSYSGSGPGTNSFSSTVATNYDAGLNLTRQASGNVVGTVINKGVMILWITTVTNFFKIAAGASATFVYIYKTKRPPLTTGATFQNNTDDILYFSDYWGESTAFKSSISLASPIRVVLGGFDTINVKAANNLESGESLMIQVIAGGLGAITGPSFGGYTFGKQQQSSVYTPYFVTPALIPFNPYPHDVVLPY